MSETQDTDRYTIKIGSYEVTKDGEELPMCEFPGITFRGTYDAVIVANEGKRNMMDTLFDAGIDTAAAKGFGKKLEALGIKKRGKKTE